MDKNKLLQLIKKEEGPKLDFKASLSLSTESEKRELTKDVIAMANSRGGRGYIIFGVEDKTKKILGIETQDFHEEQIQQIIYNRCDPPVPISVDFADIGGRMLAVLTIFRSFHKPHQMLQNGAFYIRRGSTTDIARRDEIANLFQENGMMTFETVMLKNACKTDLNPDLVKRYFSQGDMANQYPGDDLLEAMGIIAPDGESGEYHPTIGGLLLFGRNPSVFLPQVYIKVCHQEEVRYFYGSVLDMLDNAAAYIRRIIGSPAYPEGALGEALANAVIHRDYLDNSRGITVKINDKNIEISNPGALIAGNSIYRFSRESNPSRRNPWLYQRLLTLGSGQRFLNAGMGMNRIKKAFEAFGDVKFINIGSQNLFKVILPR